MKPSEFWALTYAEFFTIYKQYIKSLTHKNNIILSTAWHVAMFNRQRNLPSLESIMQKEQVEVKEQTADEMFIVCKMLNAAFGGTESIK